MTFQVQDIIIGGVPIQALLQSLLIQIMANKANRPPQHKQRIERAHFNVMLHLIIAKLSAAPDQMHKTARDIPVVTFSTSSAYSNILVLFFGKCLKA